MEKTLRVLNTLKEKQIIKDYAIGGGIATILYSEPFFTYDLDVFILLKEESENKNIVSLTSVFNYLLSEGYVFKGEHIIIKYTC